MNIGCLLPHHARYRPDHPAFFCGEERFTYKMFNAYVNKLANALLACGLVKGDKFATVLPNCTQLMAAYWAAAKTGTSKGMRDNWCIGWSDRFTVAVWVGNLEGDSMRAVSGTSGAAPVWRDVMLALHAGNPGKPPTMPDGVEARQIALPGTREPPRREYFLAGTAQSEMAAAPQAARRPRITSPVSGSVYALDPDIPLDRQRLAVIVSGDVPGYRLILDKQVLGDADAGQQILPRPGSHMLTLVDPGGKPIDRVRFTVR